jgi:hypothetical protein
MGNRTQALAQLLFSKRTIDECDVQEIHNLINKFPYYAPARFLLLEKLKSSGASEYQEQLAKTILYYHNPLEFQYLVDSGRFQVDITYDTVANEKITEQQTNVTTPIPVEVLQDDHSEDETIAQEILETPEAAEINEEETTEPEVENDPAELAVTPLSTDEITPDDIEIPDEQRHESEPTNAEASVQQAHSVFARITKEASLPSSGLSFEPYHAVDYFASQGIKLSQDEAGKDKFGKQLKSFTEWLKTMKRLPATQLAASIDSTSEHKVQHMAQDSIHESDVFTEAMAEVWLKQGNLEKAAEVYNKLSLIYPSKKAYFAAKIENLKRK